ncbi:hypothetical protein [Novosphingobium aerophilum]|uniref:Uncharacterized protein n=1 Tax=Novosphingobium aerophilum TaxID=2839843 RepID=A0A7X1KDL6_9SPHN|nr:hypothetical protein [Novosphingobium aerophilum]MBC2653287.1 hypothetical protein [Novosphingobium aerophilum]
MACQREQAPSPAEPIILDCELSGTNSSRDYLRPVASLPPKTVSERITLRITNAPLKIEQLRDDKNAFLPLCGDGRACKATQTPAEYRFTSSLNLDDKAAGYTSAEQSQLTLSRTTGTIATTWTMTHKSQASQLVMTQERAGTCKPGAKPIQKF